MRAGLVLAGTIFGAGCAPEPAEAAVLELLEFHQSGASGVFLNEALVFHFSAPVDRSSVHPESLRIRGPRGRAAAGAFSVEGANVSFHPRLPTRPDLADGGLQPGVRYTVELRGFPFPDGLRGRGGEPLAACQVLGFSTVALAEPDQAAFAPPLAPGPAYLAVEREHVSPVDPIRLLVDQPLDPRSVAHSAFELVDPDATVRLPLRVSLVENRRDGALLELRALGPGEEGLRALEPGSWYVLRLIEGAAPPRTLAGIPVEPGWTGSRLGGARISVQGRSDRVQVITFDEKSADKLWSVQPVPGADGTAEWGGGRVTIRYPRAAGSGADGEVLLHELSLARDVHATHLFLPATETATLPAEGLVVLRSQGRMDLAGALRRPPAAEPPPPMEFPAGQTLSAWLAAARALNPAWTVLIAGGDLSVSAARGLGISDAGGIDVAGPLLLVSGGRLRIADDLRAEALWKLSPGDVAGTSQPELLWVPGAGQGVPLEKRFRVDEPRWNPLVEPLTFSVLSASFRPESGVASWRPGRWEGRNGSGTARVGWLGQRFAHDRVEEYGPVDDVLLLAGSDALRFRIDLDMPASPAEKRRQGALVDALAARWPFQRLAAALAGLLKLDPWDPPSVDSLEIRWDAPLPGAEER